MNCEGSPEAVNRDKVFVFLPCFYFVIVSLSVLFGVVKLLESKLLSLSDSLQLGIIVRCKGVG